MTTLARTSSPRSSTSSRRNRDTIEQHLSERISAAIESTIKGVPDDEARGRRFLPRGDLEAILSEQELRLYLKELLSESTEEVINVAVNAIIGDPNNDSPSRRALLALFLYHQRSGLLSLFENWLVSQQNDFPSDACLPFNQGSLNARIPHKYHDHIREFQYIFIPVTIRQNIHKTFQSKQRLPYIGAPLAVTDGSSGTVFTRKVAPYHWKLNLNNGRFTPAETTKPTVLALKVFRGGRTGQEAQANFNIERSMLADLRKHNYAHKMILLDSGSFEIRDDKDCVIQHCLIFECATYTLEEFLTGIEKARTTWTDSQLLTRLVDVVEALACLHDNFDTLHLDIKPDNILVFDIPPIRLEDGSSDEAKLEWKISDFGLARKRREKERTGPLYNRNSISSPSASLLATRPAGRFQAPEVQQRGTSKASGRSDVWSMGCVILMVLGFVVDGPSRVLELLSKLELEIERGGVTDNLFYVTNDTIQWRKVTKWEHYCFDYLDNHKPASMEIPGAQHIQAAIHPEVVEWSNKLFRYCNDRSEQPILKEALGIVFLRVLLINKGKRICASDLRKYLAGVRDLWKQMEENPGKSSEVDIEPESVHNQVLVHEDFTQDPSSLLSGDSGQQPTSSEHQNTPEPSVGGSIRESLTGERANSVPSQATRTSAEGSQIHNGPPEHQEQSATNPGIEPIQQDILNHSELCSTITRMGSLCPLEQRRLRGDIREQLMRDPSQVRRPCPLLNCQSLPIYVAIRNKSYEALEVLLGEATPQDLNTKFPAYGNRTALEEACERPGDVKALRCFEPHKSKFEVNQKFYDDHKRNMTRYAGQALKELVQESTGGGWLQRVRTGRSSGSQG